MKAALILGFSGMIATAAAAPPWTTGRAQVEWSHDPKPRLVVGDKAWLCEGATCAGRLIDKPQLKLRACRALARQAGRVTDFSTPSGALQAHELARCNGERG